jgi:hypothetical protein
MAADFTVIMRVRHQFGDHRNLPGELDRNEVNVDSEAPFVRRVGEFPFLCPNVDPSQEAILQFAHRGSSQTLAFPVPQPDGGLEGITREHPVRINGIELFGGVPGAPFRFNRMPLWSTRLLIVHPGVLRPENVLRIESTEQSTVGTGLDDFTIDNVVIFFKTRFTPSPPTPFGRPNS